METQTVDADVQPGVFGRMIGVFVSPGATFASLNAHLGWKDWLFPMILVAVLTGVATHIMAPVTQEFAMQVTRERFENNPNMTDEQKEQAIQRVEGMQKAGGGAIGAVSGAVMLAVLIFISSAIFLALVNFVLGGEATYKKALAVMSLSALITIPALIVTVPLVLAQGTPFIHLGLGLLLPESMARSYLSGVLHYLSVFKIWEYAVIGIGLSAVANISTKKALWGVFALMVLIALGVGFMQRLIGGLG